MKKMSTYRILAILITATLFFAACTKEKTEIKLNPKLSTSQIFNVTSDSATVVGFVIASGDGFSERGICYNTAAAPTIDNSKVVYSATDLKATFTVKIPGLAYATKYYAKAYAIGATGTTYGEELSFTTLPVIPVLTTAVITAITGKTATGGGNVTVTGGATVTARGICIGTSHNPAVSGTKTSDGTGPGAFVSTLANLLGNTVYYVRAYAINSAGTAYGPEVTFTTPVDLPALTTAAVTGVTKISAVSGGDVTYNGGGTVTAKGLAWATTSNPTTSDNIIPGGTGTGPFVSELAGLTKYTTYHVRAYATNSAGTAYGNDIQFTTLSDILTWNIPGNYVGDSYPGSGLSDWSPDKSPQVISTLAGPNNLEGYVYMSKVSNAWKFATQTNWDGPNYGDGGAGKLDGGGGDFSSPAGYYKINVNAEATPMTYTAVATVWGVIGSASPGGWGDETALEYVPASSSWKGGMHLTAAEIKFRANHSWDFNYGSGSTSGSLRGGGDNIPVAIEDDYAITLDLSHPNAYTYKLNRWGLIGSATPGGWDSDQNLSWDGVNKVFKVTLNLVAGAMKFRADDGWDLNLGGDINALTPGGSDIAVSAAGNYTVTLDLKTMKATVTKN